MREGIRNMANEVNAGAQAGNTTTNVSDSSYGQSSSRLRVGPQHSEVRDLASGIEDNGEPALIVKRQLLEPLQPPSPMGLEEAVAKYGWTLHETCDALQSIQLGDLPHAVVSLLRETHRLQEELEASRDDFDALQTVNRTLEERTDEALAVADDQRVQLLDELERARDEILALESQLELGRQQFDSADSEIAELRAKIADCEHRLMFLE